MSFFHEIQQKLPNFFLLIFNFESKTFYCYKIQNNIKFILKPLQVYKTTEAIDIVITFFYIQDNLVS